MAEKALLQTAFHWYCPECDAENFTLPQKPEMTDDEKEACYRRFEDVEVWQELPDDWRNFEMITTPSLVTCKECKKRFETIID
jgi:hypothetical protein